MKLMCLLFSLFYFSLIDGQVSLFDQIDIEHHLLNPDSNSNEFISKVFRQNNENYISFIGKKRATLNHRFLDSLHILYPKSDREIITLRVPIRELSTLIHSDAFESLSLARKIDYQLDKALIDTRADSVHQGIDLPQSYTGKNVYIGVTDWGFDYTSPMFYDTSLSYSRIVAAWDQYKTSGPSPDGFSYGTEYSNTTALLLAESDTANIYSYATHGTHVAGIAGGSGAGTIYKGVAYEANFLFCTFLVDEAAVLDAWEWMYQKAQLDGKRLVINMSWGLYHLGTLDGNSLLSQAISEYADLGVVFVNSGGNNGNVNFHIKKIFGPNDTLLRSKIDFYPYASNPNMWGQSIHAWSQPGKHFDIGFEVLNNANGLIAEIPFLSTNGSISYIDSFLIVGLDTIEYNLAVDSSNIFNQRPGSRMRIKNTNTALKIVLKVKCYDGTIHFWNVTELSNDVGNWGMPFSYAGSGTSIGDNTHGISEPSCSDDLISVAAHATQYQVASGAWVGGARASFSSIGPRFDGTMKPDISAPGVAIISSMSSFTDVNFTSMANVNFNGRTYHFAKLSGTSMAAPMVSGIVALILEANPYLSALQVKEIVQSTARTDNYTGTISDSGNVMWGHGKIDAYSAVKLALQTIGVTESKLDQPFELFPNPSSSIVTIKHMNDLPNEALIIDAFGNISKVEINQNQINIKHLKAGKYLIRIILNGKVFQENIIKI